MTAEERLAVVRAIAHDLAIADAPRAKLIRERGGYTGIMYSDIVQLIKERSVMNKYSKEVIRDNIRRAQEIADNADMHLKGLTVPPSEGELLGFKTVASEIVTSLTALVEKFNVEPYI